MKNRVLFPALILLIFASSASAAGGDVRWLSLKDGMAKAQAEKKPMIVDFFFSKGCPRCEMLEKNVYSNQQIVKKIHDDFVPVFIDLTKPLSKEEEDLGNKYDYKNDCLMLFLNHDMTILKDPSGKKMCFVDHIEPEIFVDYLDMIRKQMKK